MTLEAIKELGFKVAGEAKNGDEAIDMYSRLKPHMITMDINMPLKDGIEALKEIRKVSKNVKIIMTTTEGQQDIVLKCIKLGACGYLLKPITKEKLKKAIEKVFPDEFEDIQKHCVAVTSEFIDIELSTQMSQTLDCNEWSHGATA